MPQSGGQRRFSWSSSHGGLIKIITFLLKLKDSFARWRRPSNAQRRTRLFAGGKRVQTFGPRAGKCAPCLNRRTSSLRRLCLDPTLAAVHHSAEQQESDRPSAPQSAI